MQQVTDDTFQQEVLASEIPVLVDFHADWCNPCRAAAPAIEALAEEYAGRVKVVKVDVDKDSKHAMEHGVRGIPNFIVFKGGQRAAQFVGWHDKVVGDIRAALDAALAS
jgi:thioredoxin 1